MVMKLIVVVVVCIYAVSRGSSNVSVVEEEFRSLTLICVDTSVMKRPASLQRSLYVHIVTVSTEATLCRDVALDGLVVNLSFESADVCESCGKHL